MGLEREGSGGRGGGKWGERGREVGIGYPPVHPLIFGVILKATNSSFQKGMTCCRCIYVKQVMKLLAFIFEQQIRIRSIIFEIEK